jgi:hypothetical protein
MFARMTGAMRASWALVGVMMVMTLGTLWFHVRTEGGILTAMLAILVPGWTTAFAAVFAAYKLGKKGGDE